MTGPSVQTIVGATSVSDASLRKFAGYQMKRSFNVLQVDLLKRLKPFGLRMVTFSTLTLIVDNPGLSQSQLAEAMAMESPNFVGIVDELHRKGLIVRDRATDDRRAYALCATDVGAKVLAQAFAAVQAHEDQLLGALTLNEREALVAMLRKVETGPKGKTT